MPFKIISESTQEDIEEEISPKFRIIDQEPSKSKEIARGFGFFGLEPKPETIETIKHPMGVSLKGLAKGILGSPGEILSFVQRLAGIKEPKKILPTTETIGNIFEKLSGEEFKPENIGEEFAERGFEFLGSILGLGGPLKATTLAKTFSRNILGAFVPGGVSLITEKAKLPPWIQAASTIGTSFLTHRLTGKGLRDIEKTLYRQSREMAGENSISAIGLKQQIKNQINNLKKGGIEESDKISLKKLNDTLGQIKNNEIKISDLMDTKVKLNETRGKLFAKDLGKPGVKAARRKLNDVALLLDKNIEKFDNPEFQKTLKQANQLHAGQAETRKIFNFISSHPQLSGLSTVALKYLFPSILKKGAPIAAGAQVGYFIKALTKFPGYRKAYFDILKNAAKEEIRGTASALKKFNKKNEELQKEGIFKIIPAQDE